MDFSKKLMFLTKKEGNSGFFLGNMGLRGRIELVKAKFPSVNSFVSVS